MDPKVAIIDHYILFKLSKLNSLRDTIVHKEMQFSTEGKKINYVN